MQTNNRKAVNNVKLFGSTKVLVISALLIAMSIVLGKLLAFNIGSSIRISFENLPLLMAGIFFGPFIGAAVGAGADLIGCMIVGYSINPIITLGAASIGFTAGAVSKLLADKGVLPQTFLSAAAGHAVGSMLIKSLGLLIYFHTPVQVLLMRIPLYTGIAVLESYIIYMLLKNKEFSSQLERICKK